MNAEPPTTQFREEQQPRGRGTLYDSGRYELGTKLSRRAYANLAIEGGLALELSRESARADFSGNGIPACVARVFPVVWVR